MSKYHRAGLLLQRGQEVLSLLQTCHLFGKGSIKLTVVLDLRDLVTATDMIKENVERGERKFAAKALPGGHG